MIPLASMAMRRSMRDRGGGGMLVNADPEMMRQRDRERKGNNATAMLVFAIIGIICGVVALAVNLVPLARGQVTRGVLFGERKSYAPGVWLGAVQIVACIGSLVFARKAINETRKETFEDYSNGMQIAGGLLSSLFGVLCVVALSAMGMASGQALRFETITTTIGEPYMDEVCRYSSYSSVCTCQNFLVEKVPSCQYLIGTLYPIYTVLAVSCAVMALANLTIACLYCAVVCRCCSPTRYYCVGGTSSSVVVVNSGGGAPQVPTNAAPPAYGQPPHGQPYEQPPHTYPTYPVHTGHAPVARVVSVAY